MTEMPQKPRRFGYARVSTFGQTLDAQLEQLRADGCARIYREKASGAQADRRELLRLLKGLAPGDVVAVTRIDRLARSTFDLFAIVKRIVDAGGQFRSLAEPWADTGTSTGRLMIAVLGGLADVGVPPAVLRFYTVAYCTPSSPPVGQRCGRGATGSDGHSAGRPGRVRGRLKGRSNAEPERIARHVDPRDRHPVYGVQCGTSARNMACIPYCTPC